MKHFIYSRGLARAGRIAKRPLKTRSARLQPRLFKICFLVVHQHWYCLGGGHPHDPYTADRQLLHPAAAYYWSSYHETIRHPHVQTFVSIPDLMEQLASRSLDDLGEISVKMRRFNDEQLIKAVRFWELAVESVLAGNTTLVQGPSVDDVPMKPDIVLTEEQQA